MRLSYCASLGVNREMLRQCPGWETERILPNITSRASPPLVITSHRSKNHHFKHGKLLLCYIYQGLCRRRAACGGNAHPGLCFFCTSHNILWIITCYDAGARVACNRSPYSNGDALLSTEFCACFQTWVRNRPADRGHEHLHRVGTSWHEKYEWDNRAVVKIRWYCVLAAW